MASATVNGASTREFPSKTRRSGNVQIAFNRELNLRPENQLARQASKREPPVYLPSTLTVARRLEENRLKLKSNFTLSFSRLPLHKRTDGRTVVLSGRRRKEGRLRRFVGCVAERERERESTKNPWCVSCKVRPRLANLSHRKRLPTLLG